MRWYEATLYGVVEVGRDATRKPVCEPSPMGAILVRTAPRSCERDATEGNAFDREDRTLLTKADPRLVKGAVACEVDGTRYDIIGTSSRESLVALRVRRCKGDGVADR